MLLVADGFVDIGAYWGYLVLSPDHDFGFSVFAAGAYAPYQPAILANLIVATCIVGFDRLVIDVLVLKAARIQPTGSIVEIR